MPHTDARTHTARKLRKPTTIIRHLITRQRGPGTIRQVPLGSLSLMFHFPPAPVRAAEAGSQRKAEARLSLSIPLHDKPSNRSNAARTRWKGHLGVCRHASIKYVRERRLKMITFKRRIFPHVIHATLSSDAFGCSCCCCCCCFISFTVLQVLKSKCFFFLTAV